MPSVYIETYGCQMNVYDTELVRGICRRAGYALAASPEAADVVLLNTCAVREKAHLRVYGRLQALRREKARRAGALTIGVLGCMAQNLKDDLLTANEHVDFVAGPDAYREIPDLIAAARGESDGPRAALKLSRTETYSGVDPVRGGGVNAWVAVMRGCDNMCTFCVVPYTRGRERSRDPEGVVAEVEGLAAAGYRQVTLLGQNVNSYRHGDTRFADLMLRVAEVDGIERVRFTSPHPKDFPPELIRAIADHPKLCNHIHLPVQAGADRVLAAMRRTYTAAQFRELVEGIREAIPGVALTTDVIVGFPTETPEEFEETRRLMEDVRFDAAFIFKYSERRGTVAARRMRDDVPDDEKTRRIVTLVELQKRITGEINRALVGTRQRVLVEERDAKHPDRLVGRTDTFKTTVIPAGEAEIGELVDVEVVDARGATLFARVVAREPGFERRRAGTGAGAAGCDATGPLADAA